MDKHLLEKARLLSKVPSESLSEEERLLLQNWVQQDQTNQYTVDRINNSKIRSRDLAKLKAFDTQQGWQRLLEKRVKQHNKTNIYSFKWMRIGVAAALLFIIGFGCYFLYQTNQNIDIQYTTIQPASNKATLTLPDGQVIELNEHSKGINVQNDSIHTADGHFIKLKKLTQTNQKLSINTPRGGQFKVVLADGTKVWLNSESKLTYPSTFENTAERIVTVEGEAFFEVAKVNKAHKHIPFVVHIGNQSIRVLGTSFNVRKHSDEGYTYTTLVEGSVEVTAAKKLLKLIPGEQAVSSVRTSLNKKAVDIQEFIAWKEGYFSFQNTALHQILSELERWYDVDFIYQNEKIKEEKFEGYIPRYSNIDAVLNILSATQKVQFKIEEKTITVNKYTKP